MWQCTAYQGIAIAPQIAVITNNFKSFLTEKLLVLRLALFAFSISLEAD
jgi:hypothetical protein